jgi:quinol-cytochrome oxidoreductase complex cytochrome b subunit
LEEKKQISSREVTAAPRSVKWLRGAIAVFVILLMSSILLNFYYWSQGAEVRMEKKALQVRYDSLLQTIQPPPK